MGYGDGPDEVARVRASADLLAGYYHGVHKATLEYIASVTPEELSRVVDERWDPPVTAERAAGEHRRRQCAAPGPGGLRAWHRVIQIRWWWPPIGVAAMILLGLAVGHGIHPARRLVPRVRATMPCASLAYLANPLVLVVARARCGGLWRCIGGGGGSRRSRSCFRRPPICSCSSSSRCSGGTTEDGLAYPSGHITMTTVVLGLFVLVAGGALWAVLIAVGYVGTRDGRGGVHVPLLHRHRRWRYCWGRRSCASRRWSPGAT